MSMNVGPADGSAESLGALAALIPVTLAGPI